MKIQDLEFVAGIIKPITIQIELLANRINSDRSTWSGNETATRLQLIDPMLRQIGWDTADPDQVKPEYSVGSRNADYVLLANERPIAVVEAKNLGVKIDSESRLQALSYVDSPSIRFVIVTNGDRWELYNSSLSETKPLGRFTISRDNPYLAAIEAAKISRDIMTATIGQVEDRTSFVPGNWTSGEVDHTLPPTDSQSWIPLDKVEYKPKGARPTRIRLPDQSEIRIRSWSKVWINIAEWMAKNEPRMTECQYGPSKHMVIKSENEGFWKDRGGYRLSNGLWIEPDVTANTLLRTARSFLKYFNFEPSSVAIRFD